MSELELRERPVGGEPEGLLVLHHGRGTDETDLLGLADVLDPGRRLHVAAPRAPMQLPGAPGYHWYIVPRVGYPDHDTFHTARGALAEAHDELWERTGIEPARTVLGGFSMGAVMSYAMGFGGDRPAVAGVLALSGFVPSVEDWRPSFEGRGGTRAFIAHGRRDPVISVEFGRAARETLEGGGVEVAYHESDLGHQIDPTHIPLAVDWLRESVPAPG